ETMSLANGTNTITLADAMVASADDNHLLTVYGGAGDDTINAGGVTTVTNHVSFDGAAGADTLTASAGADTFIYAASSDSTGTVFDTVTGMNFAADRFDIPGNAGTITQVEGARSASVSTGTFSGDITSAFATLGAHHAGLITATGGN